MTTRLKNKKLSVTPFRIEVLDLLLKEEKAVSLATFEKKLKPHDRVTLYRTLKTFMSKGIIHEIKIAGEETNYALCEQTCKDSRHTHQHVHFKCNQCQAVVCVEAVQFPTLTIPNFKISSLEIQASGRCDKCNSIS